jgi:hypothetical protein
MMLLINREGFFRGLERVSEPREEGEKGREETERSSTNWTLAAPKRKRLFLLLEKK